MIRSVVSTAKVSSTACSGPSANYRTIRDTTITTVMDVVTDILVLSFPIALLWKVRINLRQKLGLALILCLSIVMVIIALVRIAGINLAGGNVNIVWLAFWMQQECSISVIMVSSAAFRSFFVNGAANSPCPAYPPGFWKRRLLRRQHTSEREDIESANGLPRIPRATLTGMRTVIRDIRIPTSLPGRGEMESIARLSEGGRDTYSYSITTESMGRSQSWKLWE